MTPLPSYEFLSVPLWIVTLLHLVTLTLHFVAMGATFGAVGVLLAGRRDARWRTPAVRRYVKLLPTLMAFTVTLGVAPLLFLQLVYHRTAYAAAIVSGWFWLGVVVAVIAAYYLLYAAALGRREERTGRRLGLAFLCLLFVSLVFSSVFTLAERPETIAAMWGANPLGTALNPELGRWLPRWLHVVAGALALGAFAVAFAARDDEELFVSARTSYLWSMLAAIVLGVGALAGLGDDLVGYMRSSAVWWMLGSLLLAAGSLHFVWKRRLAAGGGMLLASLFAMVVQRQVARLVVLGGALDPGSIPIRPQWGVFALFLAAFVLMLGAVGWMLWLFFGGGRREAAG